MTITVQQRDLLARLGANYGQGLTCSEAARRRGGSGDGGINAVRPPIDCPKWVCCLLPCIKHVPSMRQFRLVRPDDAEIMRDGNWIRYDHGSLVVGDVVRLAEGDVVPADCVVISLGMDHVDATAVVEGGDAADEDGGDVGGNNGGDQSEITVDSHLVTGESRPRQISPMANGAVAPTTLYYGGRILEGACIAVVTATGSRTVLAKLIRQGRWPPGSDLSDEAEEIDRLENEDLESGISLTAMS